MPRSRLRGRYLEARFRTPRGNGFWPAFWAVPADGSWPPELDVFEGVGYDTDMAFFTTHFHGGGGKPASKSKAWHDPDFAAGWHTPGLLRERNQLVWYVDGVPRHRVTNPAAIPTKPMTLLLTLAIGGGSWQAKPGGATRFPGTFDVDYVRAWQR